ncbi:MAG: class B sortase [Oscillospiraceae bacterium]|nr:class B sortase [Oscillospiraceae bacterium]
MKSRAPKIAAAALALAMLTTPLLTDLAPFFTLPVKASTSDARPVRSGIYTFNRFRNSINKYKAINDDVTGWLIVPNTNMVMPIVYSDKGNTYYEHRDIYGVDYPNTTFQNFRNTATYLDARTRWSEDGWITSRNTVLYGHNWTNLGAAGKATDKGINNSHIMFGQLKSYEHIDFAAENPHIYFSTLVQEGIWRVFSVAYVEVSPSFNYNSPNPTRNSYAWLLGELQQRSLFKFDVDVQPTDKILTLTTCTRRYGVGANQRFIVVARQLRPGESETDKVAVAVNENMKKPQF